jgi:hypothetical protein
MLLRRSGFLFRTELETTSRISTLRHDEFSIEHATVQSEEQQLPAHAIAAPILSLTNIAMVCPLLVHLLASAGYHGHVPDEHPPPGLLIASTTVLRI